ncbi:MAG TPA: diaminopimelate epimerase [Coxiellaceae bacterium]|nr:MAG: diaminopimelate epimerase [Gammaproteobacteria bacterium RIFCSPHIGHO2_12_FULL_36_30]HLB55728.1 diaminopimelate epimerase [Coxiellaceae bacterium]
MSIRITKMHALGNDFVVLDAVRQKINPAKKWIQELSDRHRGVGCDQALMITTPQNKKADFGYRIFNADGNEVFQCGNGARCVGLFISQEKLSDKKIIYLETSRDIMRVNLINNDEVQVDIAIPNFNPSSLPFKATEKKSPYHLQLKNHAIEFDVVSVGNPHCVLQRDNLSQADVIEIGQGLNHHVAFPEGVNVGFVKIVSRNHIELCVYERGVGITLACGSGACAAVAVGCRHEYLDTAVTVTQSGGDVRVSWSSQDAPIQLSGSATRVFDTVVDHFEK